MVAELHSVDWGVDVPGLLERVDHDIDLLGEMLELFRQEFPKLLSEVRESVTRGDSAKIQESAHTLKGMLGGLSLSRAAACAFRIERNATGDREEIFLDLRQLEEAVQMGQSCLESLCRKGSS